MDLIFTSEEGVDVVGKIADEIMEVFERHRMSFSEQARREVEWLNAGGGVERDHWARVREYEEGEGEDR